MAESQYIADPASNIIQEITSAATMTISSNPTTANDSTTVLRVFVAGTMYDDRDANALDLRLGDSLKLMRQSENVHDANAICVQRLDNKDIGFIPKQMATWLAPFLDMHAATPYAIVTGLELQAETLHTRVQIEFKTPTAWIALMPQGVSTESQPIEYFIDVNELRSYVLLACTPDQLMTVRDILAANGFDILRNGYATWPARNGRQYDWYLKLAPLTDPQVERVAALLKQRLGATSESDRRHALEEMRIGFQQELNRQQTRLAAAREEMRLTEDIAVQTVAEKQTEIGRLVTDIERLETELENLKRRNQNLAYKAGVSSAALRARDAMQHAINADVVEIFHDIVAPALTPRQSLEVIARLFPERVVLLDSALTSADASEAFHERGKLFELLWKLAAEYWPQLVNGTGDVVARSIFGNSYSSTESQTAENNANAIHHRTFRYKGESIMMMKHLKIGVKESIYETIRVHFEWIAAEQKVVVGHCGEHLPLR